MGEIATIQQAAVSRYDDQKVIDTIRDTVCKNASNAQLQMFLQICKRTGLDPFLKEIWFVAEKSIIMAGRDGYLRVANEHPMFDGIETRVERNAQQIPVKAVCTVWRKDRTHPTICEAFYNEYKGGSPVWTKYPSAMISKVAEVLALKRSFAINGVVSEEEMDATLNPAPAVTQQQVVDAKIAQMKAGVPYAETVVPAPAPLPIPTEQQVPEAVTEMWSRMKDIASVCEMFANLKSRLADATGNDEAYYRILTEHGGGAKHANALKQKAARQCSWRLYDAILAAEAAIEPAYEAEPGGAE